MAQPSRDKDGKHVELVKAEVNVQAGAWCSLPRARGGAPLNTGRLAGSPENANTVSVHMRVEQLRELPLPQFLQEKVRVSEPRADACSWQSAANSRFARLCMGSSYETTQRQTT